MKSSRRGLWIGLGLIGILLVIVLAFVPTNRPITRGSTFSRAPDGYGAWYAYMQNQEGLAIERWQRPPDVLWDSEDEDPVTMVQIYPPEERVLQYDWNRWVEKGNTLIVLRSQDQVTRAPFSSRLTSPLFPKVGAVQIDTRRRQRLLSGPDYTELLGDEHGAVVWQRTQGSGQMIEATTPKIGANAYQDAPGNFAFLAAIIRDASATNATLFVDEYLHGYEELEPEDEITEIQATWVSYLAQTPLALVVVQAIALCLALLWGYQRIGPPTVIPQPVQNNSEAYISALAGVLREAKSTQFVVEMVTKAEQLRLQKALGLGATLIDDATLISVWTQQTKRSPTDLQHMLDLSKQPSPPTEKDLVHWLNTIRTLHSEKT